MDERHGGKRCAGADPQQQPRTRADLVFFVEPAGQDFFRGKPGGIAGVLPANPYSSGTA